MPVGAGETAAQRNRFALLSRSYGSRVRDHQDLQPRLSSIRRGFSAEFSAEHEADCLVCAGPRDGLLRRHEAEFVLIRSTGF